MSNSNELLSKLNSFLQLIGAEYVVCGGHAIDLFIGQKTRPHKDLDISMFWNDRDQVINYLLRLEWMVFEPIGTEHLHRISNEVSQQRLRSNIWCILPSNQHYQIVEHDDDMYSVTHDDNEQTELDYIEILFNRQENGYFLYSRNRDVKRAMDMAILHNHGIPYLAPEIVLLYKSTSPDAFGNQGDFSITIPLLSQNRKNWLLEALKTMYPNGHIWLNPCDILRVKLARS